MASAGTSGLTASVAEDVFLGQRLALLDVPEAAATIAARPADLPFTYVVTPNAQHFVRLDRGEDPAFQAAYDGAWMRLCDSRVVCLLAKRVFGRNLKQAAGSDLTAYMLHNTIRPDDAVTVVGGNEDLRQKLMAQFGLRHLALISPPMGLAGKPEELARCVEFVVANPARYVFFAVGTPTGENLAHRVARDGRATGVGLCIGGSLHFATGVVKRAPPVFRQLGLEWLHRLALNPRRHARRVFVESLPLLRIVARDRLKRGTGPGTR
ncbi:exopolysaccharide biosynthesis WecB/TagA/CpsF family protein [Stella humosa]|uniref:Exopolysaccharide biosynthesis WecB/TagA/CpsF family protein n=1 Tax=Stella humosa TaxID=94 RepID=A0A3N1MBZ1_9PROT|nr:WecB/TagA/CpsF family glycosyltransferase [Stella humosa]ROQ03352.1 exopolysaccharide biosynthesis WecB/TagA/CpsF family protein [Stella humosa]BBK29639.1 glycosyl transferase [Stella humosa]